MTSIPSPPAFTVDGPTSRDLDDALWVEPDASGWRVTVYVADVAAVVHHDDDLDRAARAQAETLYRAWGNTPMLPRGLAENVLALRPLRPRRTLAVTLTLDASLALRDTSLACVTIRSRARLTHADVPRIVEDTAHPLHLPLDRAATLARGLLARRRATGALAFYDLRQGWATTEEGALRAVAPRHATVGYVIVQELMILANAAVAQWCVVRDLPVLFRNHVARVATPPREALLRELDASAQAPASLREALSARGEILLGRAEYGAELRGHWGLALPAYLHMTSPIRRYADLVNHRQLRAAVTGATPPYDRDAVAALGAELNATLAAARAAQSAAFKAAATVRAEHATAEHRLATADAATFERAVRIETARGGDPTPAFVDAVRDRLARDQVPLVCLTLILARAPFTEAWRPLRADVLSTLGRRPEDALSLLAQAPSLVPSWRAPQYTVSAVGPSHAPTFKATACLVCIAGPATTHVVSPPARDRVKKRALQRAAVLLLAHVARVEPPPEVRDDAPPASTVVLPPVPESSRNPVSVLMEWCQRARLQPVFDALPPEGLPHAPTMTYHCTVDGRRGVGRGPNKAAAKQAAAADVLRALSEPGDSMHLTSMPSFDPDRSVPDDGRSA